MTQHGRRIRFLVDWDWKPSPMATIAYRAGQTYYVTMACAEKAIALGKAEPVVGAGAPPAGIGATLARKRRKKADDNA
jgi:hypothetical protein